MRKPNKVIELPHGSSPVTGSSPLVSVMSQRRTRPADSCFSPLGDGKKITWPHYPHVPMGDMAVEFFTGLADELQKQLGKPVAPMQAAALFLEFSLYNATQGHTELAESIVKRG